MDASATVDAVSKKLGISLKKHQRDALVHLVDQKSDLLVNLPVGYGKSLIYSLLPDVLAAVRESPVVIVFSPLNIIQKDQLESLKRLRITACRLNQSGKVDGSTDTTQFPVDLMSSPLLSPMPVSALEVDGWEMVFRAQSGNGQSVYDAWIKGTGVSEVKPSFVGRSYASHYRDPRIAQWNMLHVQQVKYALYYENREVAFIIFDGIKSDNINWFDKTKVIASSYSDLTTAGTYNYFSIAGHAFNSHHFRRFFINKVYIQCPDDIGWLNVADIGSVNGCAMDKEKALPQFLYSTINAADFWEKGRYGRADYMAIFIKTDYVK